MRYRLQYYDRQKTKLAIQWAQHRKNYVPGDFYVMTIKETTDANAHNKAHGQRQLYTTPCSLDKAKALITVIGVGKKVRDCVGLSLEDDLTFVIFDEPVPIRTIPQSTIESAPKSMINAAEIRYRVWYEYTFNVLSAVWGEEKAKLKLKEYKPPQELLDQLSVEEILRRR